MDPGQVVWLPGGGYGDDYNAVCEEHYGGGYYACNVEPWYGGVMVYCCPY